MRLKMRSGKKSPRPNTPRHGDENQSRTAADFMTALANRAAHIHAAATCLAYLLPSLAKWLDDLFFHGFFGSKPNHPRFIRLFYRTLRVNAACRITGRPANWANTLRPWGNYRG
jgi:hypothetical protein